MYEEMDDYNDDDDDEEEEKKKEMEIPLKKSLKENDDY
jgi:methionine-rich copper-binding protein CopC